MHMATQPNDDSPPAFEPVNNIELSSIKDSKIVKVSVYSSRAEVTRHCKFTVSTGQNLVQINGLPDVLEAQSLRYVFLPVFVSQNTYSADEGSKDEATLLYTMSFCLQYLGLLLRRLQPNSLTCRKNTTSYRKLWEGSGRPSSPSRTTLLQ